MNHRPMATKANEPSVPTLRFDVVAGLTAAAVVLPKAMAYATVAGLPVAVGLYTAFVPMIVYALLGSSRVLSVSSTTTLATEMLDAATFAFGSPTLNGTLMPQAAAVLTYLKGLKPAGKAGFAFGSYGWAKGGAQEVNEYLEDMKVRILREPIQVQYVPRADDLALCREAGSMLADQALEISQQTKQE